MAFPSAPYIARARACTRKRPSHPEYAFHCSVAQYLDKALPPECWWTTFPAGGGGKARGGKLKAMGLKAGVPDILILHRRPSCHRVLWLELKAAKGTLSDSQALFLRAMHPFHSTGLGAAVARSLEDVEAILRDFGVKPRATVAMFAKKTPATNAAASADLRTTTEPVHD